MLYGESQYVIPSQFLSDIPQELLETNEKTLNLHNRFARKISHFNKKPIPTESIASQISQIQEFSDGDSVMHAIFGKGIVINVTGGIITVAFKDPKIGIKKLALAIAPLEKI